MDAHLGKSWNAVRERFEDETVAPVESKPPVSVRLRDLLERNFKIAQMADGLKHRIKQPRPEPNEGSSTSPDESLTGLLDRLELVAGRLEETIARTDSAI